MLGETSCYQDIDVGQTAGVCHAFQCSHHDCHVIVPLATLNVPYFVEGLELEMLFGARYHHNLAVARRLS